MGVMVGENRRTCRLMPPGRGRGSSPRGSSGKTVQKIAFVPVMLFIYPFCAPAKSALRQFYGVLAEWRG